jgi:hypothetical protein
VALLNMRKSIASTEWVFPAPTKTGHMEQSTLKKRHATACKLAGIGDLPFYTFRHTCLTRWSSHMDPYTLAYYAGHSDFATTRRYVHPDMETGRAAMERVFHEVSPYVGQYRVNCAYPLVRDTLRECFDLTALRAGKSIEDLFADAIAEGNYDPLEKLANRLRKADHYIANRIAGHEKRSSYRKFFEAFARSSFLTFNYDSLPETVLHNLDLWYPHDGYGEPVATFLPPGNEHLRERQSSAFVLHLHGSLCIATSETEVRRRPGQTMRWLSPRDRPLFKFDPSSIGMNFPRYEREPGSDDARDRVIAPVPDKSPWLSESFIRATYVKAEALLQESEIAVAIGYSFNQHDRASYEPLLCALRRSP